MYLDKERLAAHLFEALDNAILGETSIDDLLTGNQKYELVMLLLRSLPTTNHEKINEFYSSFKMKQEETHIVTEYKNPELPVRLIMEECVELAHGLGLTAGVVISMFNEFFGKIYTEPKDPHAIKVIDALTDLLYVVYGSFYLLNLTKTAEPAMEEVHSSNMSKLLPSGIPDEKLKEIVADLRSRGFNPMTENLKNGYLAIKDNDTGKVLKPKTYREADLGKVFHRYVEDN